LLIQGNATQISMKDKSVQLCCFSPPYWGLRKYSVKPLVWGADNECQHEWITQEQLMANSSSGTGKQATDKGTLGVATKRTIEQTFCQRCGAWRGDLGLEPTPELYLDHMMLVMAECWRVLRDDGVCFVNLGDTYSTHTAKRSGQFGKDIKKGFDDVFRKARAIPYREKSLCLIPQKFAIRCQEAGWIIRSEIIWAKPNPMPESVKDRPTRSHEQVWLMVKEGKYYWDQDAVAEPQVEHERIRRLREKDQGLNTVYNIAQDGKTGIADQSQTGTVRNVAVRQRLAEKGTRNIRDVWTMATRPTPEAHFATWPMELCDKMIRAASKLGDIVLDPFCGTAQTVLKAEELNRIGVGMDLSWEYISEIAKVKYDRLLQRELYVH